jgi:hypothetical protein
MVRACLPVVVAFCTGLAAGGAAAQKVRPLVPTGGMWQSIPYASESPDPGKESTRGIESKASSAILRQAEKSAKSTPAAGPKAKAPRHPVAAAAISEEPPPTTAAARTRELERRLDVLLPGTRLGESMNDPQNPSWRRPRPGRPSGENNTLSLPIDEKGQSGFVARGYNVQPDVQNPHGNTGATIGLRTKF